MVAPVLGTGIERDGAEPSEHWLLWQLADSAFPAGGFAHSGGLEAAWQYGEVRGRNELVSFLEAALDQCGHAALPFVAAAFDAQQPFASIDLFCDAFTSNHVANRGSRAQGQAFLASTDRIFDRPRLKSLRSEVRDLPGHFAPVFGAVTGALDLERTSALRLFLFSQLRAWISSAVRLGIVGSLEGQSLHAGLAPRAETVLGQCAHLLLDQIAQTAPLLELFQASQDRLYSRLFQS